MKLTHIDRTLILSAMVLFALDLSNLLVLAVVQ